MGIGPKLIVNWPSDDLQTREQMLRALGRPGISRQLESESLGGDRGDMKAPVNRPRVSVPKPDAEKAPSPVKANPLQGLYRHRDIDAQGLS
jgi:hypothetical protein